MVAPLTPDDPASLGGYTLTGRLGEGGQGIVYLGRSPEGTPVAVKLLKGGFDPGVRQRLARELDAMRGVASFCTARVLAAEVTGREPYVVSEFIDGPALQDRVTAAGPLRGGELERLAVGTATALAAIHGAGIVHRDFKPGNVLLGPDGPRVVDFGIARQSESATLTAGPVGTPAYLAPEQLAGHPAGPASDVFAWGATMVFAATGQAAFGSATVASVLHRIMTATPDTSAVPEPLRSAVDRCLSKDPALRPSSRDLLLELVGSAPDPLRAGAAAAEPPADPWTSPPPGTARSDGTTTAPGKAGRKSNRGLVAALVVAVLALAATGAVLVPRLLADQSGSASGGPGSTSTTTPAPETPAPEDTVTVGTVTGLTDETPEPSESADTEGTEGIPGAFAGNWAGHIVPTTPVMSEHDIRIELREGKPSGRWYENECVGTLTFERMSGKAGIFRLSDAGQCIPGTVTLTRKGDRLAYQWDDDMGLVTYTGDLTKE
ncbi:serine/threonine-protein kinase [Acrocarpospora catenulata]|uniref:serine/threonine-protein kinase n=1 Tax=Acrocarpospora catenulata TaxID=2836182 RepID=UPI001BDA572E|nr:serine/threonine-protein kinase [Acrocarpospora catenulata]